LNSGSIIPALPVNHRKAQDVYDSVAFAAGCLNTWSETTTDSLACLRKVPYTQLLNAMNSVHGVFGYRSVDLAYLPRPDPSDNFFAVSPEAAVQNGSFAKVPIIIGDQEDEGTLFSLSQFNITTTKQLTAYLKSFFPNAKQSDIADLVATYPDHMADGSPFDSGLLNEIYPQYKRLAAILGDATFTLSRRAYLSKISSHVPAWSYMSSYFTGTPVLGTFHASDVLELYFDLPSLSAAVNAHAYYVSFINFGNPNSNLNTLLTPWPKYSLENPQLLNFGALTNTILPDTFRQKSYEKLVSIQSSLRI
jgi:carboxylesterase type B